MADPATMTDDELNKVIETGIEPEEEPESNTPAPSQDEPEEPAEEPEAPDEPEAPADDDQEDGEDEAPEPLSPRAQKRMEQLKIVEQINRIKSQSAPQPQRPAPAPTTGGMNYNEALNADPEVVQQLEADRNAVAEARYNDGLKANEALIQTSEWRTLLSIDAPTTEDKYKWLNPKDKANFVPALADAMNTEYMHLVGYDERTGLVQNPGVRYSDFVEAKVELATRIAESMNAKTTKNIVKQAATTGLRPDGSSAKRMNLNKPAQDMSMEELYASIGQTPPK